MLLEDVNNLNVWKYEIVNARKYLEYAKIMIAVSGGSDSDIILDMFARIDTDKKVEYVFYDTGIEYETTKRHLEFLENKYGIIIKREKAIKAIPVSCKQHGQPFLSKRVSDMIERLQRHNFQWEDESFEVLYAKYPKCKASLRWWCNDFGEKSQFNIERNKGLREFIIENPPQFLISAKCCDYAKKNLAKKYIKENDIDLNITGVRRSEGGARATAYKSCFSDNNGECDDYRPLFFFTNEDKEVYKKHFGIINSDCYEVWGMKRTGCVGCPFGQNLKKELELCEKYEPQLYKACCSIFVDSYEYTMKYKKYKEHL